MSHDADDFFKADAERLGYLKLGGPGMRQYYRDHGMSVPGRGYTGRSDDPEIPMDPDTVVRIIDHGGDQRSTNGRYSGTGHLAISDDE